MGNNHQEWRERSKGCRWHCHPLLLGECGRERPPRGLGGNPTSLRSCYTRSGGSAVFHSCSESNCPAQDFHHSSWLASKAGGFEGTPFIMLVLVTQLSATHLTASTALCCGCAALCPCFRHAAWSPCSRRRICVVAKWSNETWYWLFGNAPVASSSWRWTRVLSPAPSAPGSVW